MLAAPVAWVFCPSVVVVLVLELPEPLRALVPISLSLLKSILIGLGW